MAKPEDKENEINMVIYFGVAKYRSLTAIVMQLMALGKFSQLMHGINSKFDYYR